jgi:hypothetical protein
MSLMRLLAAGRSLMGGDDRMNRYRLPRRQPMPHFGGDANPFASTVLPGGARGGVVATAAVEPAAAPSAPEAARPTATPAHRPGWFARLNPFRRRVTAAKPSLPVAPIPAKQAVLAAVIQPELSLLSVQVVRNDLSDADEAVPRSRLKGRQLLGRAFPRVVPAGDPGEDELPVESVPVRELAATPAKLL